MISKIDTAPTEEPVSIDEAKTHCRIENTEENGYVQGLIVAARQMVENYTNRALITQTWKAYFDRFPIGYNPVDLPKAPVQSVTSITYVDSDGDTQTLASSEYTVDTDSEPGRFYLAYNKTWPSVRNVAKAVTVTFTAGYGDAEDVPDAIKQAMFLMIGHLYENREVLSPVKLEEVPMAFKALLSPYRIWTL